MATYGNGNLEILEIPIFLEKPVNPVYPGNLANLEILGNWEILGNQGIHIWQCMATYGSIVQHMAR